MSAPVWYSHASPGWWKSGSVAYCCIHPSTSGSAAGLGRTGAHPTPVELAQDRQRPGLGRDHPVAEPEREQIADGDRAVGRHRVVDLAVERAQHAAVRQLGEQGVDGIVESQPAFLDEQHRRDRGDRLGHGRDPKDRVAAHRPVLAHGVDADRVDVHVARAGHHPHEARMRAVVHVALQHVAQPFESGLREPAVSHLRLLMALSWGSSLRGQTGGGAGTHRWTGGPPAGAATSPAQSPGRPGLSRWPRRPPRDPGDRRRPRT